MKQTKEEFQAELDFLTSIHGTLTLSHRFAMVNPKTTKIVWFTMRDGAGPVVATEC